MSLFIAELFGTFVLFLLGTSAYCMARFSGSLQKIEGRLEIAIAWGLGWAIAIYMVHPISEGHLNPAVTLGYAVIGQVPWKWVPLYLGGQLVGSFLGAGCAYLLFWTRWARLPSNSNLLPLFATPSTPGWSPLVAALLPSFIFLAGMIAVRSTDVAAMAPFLIGLIVLALYAACGTAPGFTLNPARDLGSRAFCTLLPGRQGSGEWRSALLPIFIPIIGGILGAFTYQGFLTLIHR
ncbi:MAG: MIP/aquaporin family protein [Parachlamydiales bacterium]